MSIRNINNIILNCNNEINSPIIPKDDGNIINCYVNVNFLECPKYNILNYTTAFNNEQYFKAAYILVELLKDNHNIESIKKLINQEHFFKVYSILNHRVSYLNLYFINNLLPSSFMSYYYKNKEEIRGLKLILKSKIEDYNIIYLFNKCNKNSYDYDNILSLKPDDIYLKIMNNINTVLDIDVNVLSNMLLFYYYIYNDIIENKNQDFINLKTAHFINESSVNTDKYKLLIYDYIFFNKKTNIESVKYIIQRKNIFYPNAFKEIKSDNFLYKFNTYVYNLLKNGYFSMNLFEWFIIFNNKIKNLEEYMSIIFDIPQDKIYIVYNLLTESNLVLTKANMKIKENELNIQNDIIFSQNIDIYGKDNIFILNDTVIQKLITNNIILTRINLKTNSIYSTFNTFINFNNISPFGTGFKNNFEFVLTNSSNDIELFDKNITQLIKIYNTLQLINANGEIICILKNEQMIQINILNIQELDDFDSNLLYCHINKFLIENNIQPDELLNNNIYNYISNDLFFIDELKQNLPENLRNGLNIKLNSICN